MPEPVSDELLAGYAEGKDLVSIQRDRIDANSQQAFILALSPSLVLLNYVYDFHVDGMLVVRRQDITSVKHKETDRFQQQLLEEAGLLNHLEHSLTTEIGSISGFLDAQPKNAIVILEKESLEDESRFYIGRYAGVDKDGFLKLHEFSGAANWDKKLTFVHEEDVTCCQTNTNYIRFYAKYFESVQPPPLPVE